MKKKICTACLGHRMIDCKRCNGTGEEPKANRTEDEKCIRVWYDLYECPCSKCIDLDIQREGNTQKKKVVM